MGARKEKPLKARRIAVTRATEQVGELAQKLKAAGAEVIELPLIEIHYDVDKEVRDEVFKELWTYEWIVFTSPNGVKYFFEAFFEKFDDIRAFGTMRIAAVGKGTEKALNAFYLRADLKPESANAEALARALQEEQTLDNLKMLLIAGNRNSEALAERLEAAMAIVDSLRVYRTDKRDLSTDDRAAQFRKTGADAIVFASPSAVESFVDQAAALQMETSARRPIGCSIGPTTSEAMRRLKIPVDVVAKEPTMKAVV